MAVERFFKYTDGGRELDLMVDVVINGGGGWVKLFARKRRALHKKWLGTCMHVLTMNYFYNKFKHAVFRYGV